MTKPKLKDRKQSRSIEDRIIYGANELGGQISSRRPTWQVYLTAFGLPFMALLLVWTFAGVVFGNKMILAHDQWHQYYPFFLDLQRKLKSGGSLFYSWTNAMGTNYLSMAAYYLASPMNLLAGLLPESAALGYYTFTVMVKISLASTFFAVFLRKLFDRSDLSVVFFSVLYSFCAFVCGYYWNAIWLDTVALLPLVALGAVYLLRDGKFILYTSMLALSVFCSYYIGLFTCIFVLLLFICYNICYWDDFSSFGVRLVRIAFFSVLGIGMTALLSLPAFLGLQSTSSADNTFPEEFALNIVSDKSWLGILDGLRQIISQLGTGILPTSMDGLPNIACGTVSVVLAIVYFTTGKIKLREKLCAAGLLLFFAMSFLIRQLDYIWHGFHFPNMLPYRFSFLFSFVVLFMAYRAFIKLDRFRWYQCLYIAPFAVLFLFCVFSAQSVVIGILTTVLVLLTVAGLYAYSKKILPKNLLTLLLCGLLLAEACIGLGRGTETVGFTGGSSYPKSSEDVSQVIAEMNDREEDTVDLWRAETTRTQTLNDNALNGYNGISTFSSAANCGVSRFLKSIGLPASVGSNRYSYDETVPLTNLMLGLKYLIDRDGLDVERPYFETVTTSGDVVLLENTAYVPMGFMLSEDVLEYDTEVQISSTRTANLNYLYQLISGKQDNLLTQFELSERTADDGLTMTGSGSQFTLSAEEESSEDAKAHFTYRIQEDCHFCVYTASSNLNNVSISLNGEELVSYNTRYGYLRDFGILHAGDVLTYSVSPKEGKDGVLTIYAAVYDDAAFDSLYETISAQQMKATEVTDTSVSGTITAETEGICYFSIPYDTGWSVTVDGKAASVVSIFGAFIGVRLSKGTHDICLTYETPGFRVGLTVSLICLAIFFVLIVIELLRKLLTPPIEQVDMEMLGHSSKKNKNRTAPEQQEPASDDAAEEASGLDELPETDGENIPEMFGDETQILPTVETATQPDDDQLDTLLEDVNGLLLEASSEEEQTEKI